MVAFVTRTPRLPIVAPPILTTLLPNDAKITYSDLAGTWTVNTARARPRRSIIDGQGFDYATPSARASLSITATVPTAIVVNVAYTGLVIRGDTYNDIGAVIVGAGVSAEFICPNAHSPGAAHPTGSKAVLVQVPAGTSTVAIVWPYCASLDLISIGLPAGVTANAAPARVAKKFVGFGDSRVHGFNATKTLQSWFPKVCDLKSAQALNMGCGGRQITPGDGTTAGAFGADAAVLVIGYNSFYPNGANITAVQANYLSYITNYRAAASAAGKATSKLIMVSDFWAEADIPAGPYAANSPTLQAFRNAMQAAVTAAADANCSFLSGNTGAMPTGYGTTPDGVHFNDTGSSAAAAAIAAVLP
jgi:hypothetical protein